MASAAVSAAAAASTATEFTLPNNLNLENSPGLVAEYATNFNGRLDSSEDSVRAPLQQAYFVLHRDV